MPRNSTSRWLYTSVCALYADGEALIAASKQHGSRRVSWLLAQLTERGDVALVEEFERRRKATAAEYYWRDRRASLARLEANIAALQRAGSDARLGHMRQRVEKLRKTIERHDARQQAEK